MYQPHRAVSRPLFSGGGGQAPLAPLPARSASATSSAALGPFSSSFAANTTSTSSSLFRPSSNFEPASAVSSGSLGRSAVPAAAPSYDPSSPSSICHALRGSAKAPASDHATTTKRQTSLVGDLLLVASRLSDGDGHAQLVRDLVRTGDLAFLMRLLRERADKAHQALLAILTPSQGQALVPGRGGGVGPAAAAQAQMHHSANSHTGQLSAQLEGDLALSREIVRLLQLFHGEVIDGISIIEGLSNDDARQLLLASVSSWSSLHALHSALDRGLGTIQTNLSNSWRLLPELATMVLESYCKLQMHHRDMLTEEAATTMDTKRMIVELLRRPLELMRDVLTPPPSDTREVPRTRSLSTAVQRSLLVSLSPLLQVLVTLPKTVGSGGLFKLFCLVCDLALPSIVDEGQQQQLLLCVFESDLHSLSACTSSRNKAARLEMLVMNEEVVQPLISRVMFDERPRLPLLVAAVSILQKWFDLMSTEEGRQTAMTFVTSGLFHVLMPHLARLQDLDAESRLQLQGSDVALVGKPLIQLLADILARTTEFAWESTKVAAWREAIEKVQVVSWSGLCRAAVQSLSSSSSTSGVSDPMSIADVHLALISKWLQSHSESPLRDEREQLPIQGVVKTIEGILALNHQTVISKTQLIRLCQLLRLCEVFRDVSIDPRSKDRLFHLSLEQSWHTTDLFGVRLWHWLWSSNPVASTKLLQQRMISCALLEAPIGQSLTLHLTQVVSWLRGIGMAGYRSLLAKINSLLMRDDQAPSASDGPSASSEYCGSNRQLANRVMSALSMLCEDPATLGALKRLGLADTMATLFSRRWHLTGMFESPIAPMSSLAVSTAEEAAERAILDTHERLVAICASIEDTDSQGANGGEASHDNAIIEGLLEMFQRHLLAPVPNLRLHLRVLELLLSVLRREYSLRQHRTLRLLSSARSLEVLRWTVSHLPSEEESAMATTTAAMARLFRPTPGLQADLDQVEQVKALQKEMKVRLLRVLCALIRAVAQLNAHPSGPAEFSQAVSGQAFAMLISVPTLCFMASLPMPDLRAAVHEFLTCCVQGGFFVLTLKDSIDSNEPPSESVLVSYDSIRRLCLSIQATLQRTLHSGQPNDQKLSEAAIGCMQAMLEKADVETRRKMVNTMSLPWHTFILRMQLAHLRSSGSVTLDPCFVHYFALVAGWCGGEEIVKPEETWLRELCGEDQAPMLLTAALSHLRTQARVDGAGAQCKTFTQHAFHLVDQLVSAEVFTADDLTQVAAVIEMIQAAWPASDADSSSHRCQSKACSCHPQSSHLSGEPRAALVKRVDALHRSLQAELQKMADSENELVAQPAVTAEASHDDEMMVDDGAASPEVADSPIIVPDPPGATNSLPASANHALSNNSKFPPPSNTNDPAQRADGTLPLPQQDSQEHELASQLDQMFE